MSEKLGRSGFAGNIKVGLKGRLKDLTTDLVLHPTIRHNENGGSLDDNKPVRGIYKSSKQIIVDFFNTHAPDSIAHRSISLRREPFSSSSDKVIQDTFDRKQKEKYAEQVSAVPVAFSTNLGEEEVTGERPPDLDHVPGQRGIKDPAVKDSKTFADALSSNEEIREVIAKLRGEGKQVWASWTVGKVVLTVLGAVALTAGTGILLHEIQEHNKEDKK